MLAQSEFVESGDNVLKPGNFNKLLGNTLMCWLFVLVDALGEVESGTECPAHEFNDITWYCGGEHHVLAGHLFWVWQELPDLVNLPGEAFVEQAISLVHDKGIEVRCLDTRVGVG